MATPGMGELGEAELMREMIGGPPPGSRLPWRDGRPRVWRVTIFVLAAVFFIGPLAAAFKYSLQQDSGGYGFANYGEIIHNKTVRAPLVTSLEIAVITAAIVILLMLPTVVWVRLKKPKATAAMELITLLPIVMPPVVMAAGLEELSLTAPPWMVKYVFRPAPSGVGSLLCRAGDAVRVPRARHRRAGDRPPHAGRCLAEPRRLVAVGARPGRAARTFGPRCSERCS